MCCSTTAQTNATNYQIWWNAWWMSCSVYLSLYCLAATCILCLYNISTAKGNPCRFNSVDASILRNIHYSSFSTFPIEDEVFTHHAPPPAPVAVSAQPQAATSKSLLPKVNQSGLRPPGSSSSSRHPAGRLAAFGFVRSSSVSSVSSAHSADSTQSDPCRTAHREWFQGCFHKHLLYCYIMSAPSSYCFYYLPLCIPLMNIVCINSPLPHSLCYNLLYLPELLPASNVFFSVFSSSTSLTTMQLQCSKAHFIKDMRAQ